MNDRYTINRTIDTGELPAKGASHSFLFLKLAFLPHFLNELSNKYKERLYLTIGLNINLV